MKKLSLYIFLVLLVCNVGFAQCIEGDCKNGYGTFTFPDGRKYVGESKDNKKHGQGTYTWASGAEYVGEWKDDTMHGVGTHTWKGGDKYVGEFKDGQSHGQGTYTWIIGSKYVGQYKDGEQHGQGTYTHGDGTKYVGEFKDSEYHGQGTLTYTDGRIDNGIWKKGKLIKRQEYMLLNCKEIGGDKTYSYLIEDKYISFGFAKYKIEKKNDIRIIAKKENLKNEYGYINVDRVKGTIEHTHGLGGKSEELFKMNVIFSYNLKCEKVESKF